METAVEFSHSPTKKHNTHLEPVMFVIPEQNNLTSQINALYRYIDRQAKQIRDLDNVKKWLSIELLLEGKWPAAFSMGDLFSFEFDYFVVGCFDLYDTSQFFEESGKLKIKDDELRSIKEIVATTLESMLGTSFIVFCCDGHQCMGSILLNVPNLNVTENLGIEDTLVTEAYKALHEVERLCGIKLYLSLSSCTKEVSRLPKAVKEALQLLTLQRETPNTAQLVYAKRINLFQDVLLREITPESNAFSSQLLERQLLQSLVERDLVSANTCMRQIAVAEMNRGRNIVELSHFIAKQFDTVHHFLELEHNGFGALISAKNRLSGVKTIDELLAFIGEYFSSMEVLLRSQTDENVQAISTDQLAKDIHEYLDSNYADINLNLTMVALNLGITQSKTSRIFRNKYGFGVLQYIQKLRIDKAMTLLVETAMDIDSIYAAVGYTNRRTFDRTFKQFNCVTAVNYRKNPTKQTGISSQNNPW